VTRVLITSLLSARWAAGRDVNAGLSARVTMSAAVKA
jgi:hypothetical protein